MMTDSETTPGESGTTSVSSKPAPAPKRRPGKRGAKRKAEHKARKRTARKARRAAPGSSKAPTYALVARLGKPTYDRAWRKVAALKKSGQETSMASWLTGLIERGAK
jgi:hypothetical protein